MRAVNARDLDGRLAIDYADTQSVALIGCDAERALDRLAYDTPIIDCIGGQQLATVIARFQNDSQLRPAGELDSATRRALDIL